MNININLLPKRERPQSPALILTAIISVCMLATGVWAYTVWSSVKQETDQLTKQVLSVKVQAEQSKKTTEQTVTPSIPKLEPIVKMVEAQRVTIVPFLKQITSLLPGNGVFQSFSYQDSGVVILDVRFAERRDAAYFYGRLTEESWLQDVKLSSLQAIDTQQQGQQQGVPSYVAHYELTLNKAELQKQEKEGQQ